MAEVLLQAIKASDPSGQGAPSLLEEARKVLPKRAAHSELSPDSTSPGQLCLFWSGDHAAARSRS